MSDFRFDAGKTFQANRAAFLDALAAIDPDMAAILTENAEALASVVAEGERDAKARADFNAKIMTALDRLVGADTGSEPA